MSVALVACGDSGPSRADYIAKADAFCKERNAIDGRADEIAQDYGFKECGSGANEADAGA